MLLGTTFPPKQPAENYIVEIDFDNDLDTLETISTPTVTSKNLATGADSTGTFLSGSPNITGTKVQQRVAGGANGERHRVQMRITTSNSNTYEHELDVPVEEF